MRPGPPRGRTPCASTLSTPRKGRAGFRFERYGASQALPRWPLRTCWRPNVPGLRAERAAGLEWLHAFRQCGAVQNRGEVVRLGLARRGRPVQLVLDDGSRVGDAGCRERVARGGVHDALRRDRELVGNVALEVE